MKNLGIINATLLKIAPRGFRWIYVYCKLDILLDSKKIKGSILTSRNKYKIGQTDKSSVWGRVDSQMNASTDSSLVILRAYLVPEHITDNNIHYLIERNGGKKVRDNEKLNIGENIINNVGIEWYITELQTVDNIIKNINGCKIKYQKNEPVFVNKTNIIELHKESNDKVNAFIEFWDYIYSIKKHITHHEKNIISQIYINFINILRSHQNEYYNWDHFYTEDLKPCLYNDMHFRELFNQMFNSTFESSCNHDLHDIMNSFKIDIKSLFEKLFNEIKKHNLLNSTEIYNGIKIEGNHKEFSTFMTKLYAKNTFFKHRVSFLNINMNSHIILYRMTIETLELIINEAYKSYDGIKDTDFYKTVINNIIIVVDSDYMKEIWKQLIISKYSKYNIIESDITIINISCNVKKLNEYMSEKKRFDICLMNPPYNKNLHLEFLKDMIKYSNHVISIQPIRWLIDPNSKFNKSKRVAINKYEDSICKYIYDFEKITDVKAESFFDACFTMDLGIYCCNTIGGYNYKSLSEDRIFDYIVNNLNDNIKNHLECSTPKNAVTISLITGGNNGRKSHVIDLFYTFNDPKQYIYDSDGKRLDNGLTFYENRKKLLGATFH